LLRPIGEAGHAGADGTENRNPFALIFQRLSAAGFITTPVPRVLRIERAGIGAGGVLELKVRQHTLPTPGQPQTAATGSDSFGPWPAGRWPGEELPLAPKPAGASIQASRIFVFADLPQFQRAAALSLVVGGFSCRCGEIERQRLSCCCLLCRFSDPFRPWDARSDPLAQAVAQPPRR